MRRTRSDNAEGQATAEGTRKMKAPNNDGSVYELGDGRWQAAVSIHGDDGKAKRVTRTRRTEKEALRALHGMLAQRDSGTLINAKRDTVQGYLDHWLEHTKKPEVRPHTYESYYSRIHHAVAHLGAFQLRNLRPAHIEVMRSSMLSARYAPSTVNAVLRVLKTALDDAVNRNLLVVNPCRKVRPAQEPEKDRQILVARFIPLLLAESEGTRYCALWHVLLGCGLRLGEALALTWEDVEGPSIRIAKTTTQGRGVHGYFIGPPKTPSSRRTVPIPLPVEAALKRHRAVMNALQLSTKDWEDHDLVFAGQHGGILSPKSVREALRRDLAAIGAPDMSPHGLRHTFATHQSMIGIPGEVTQRLLGHSSITVTKDVYTQVQPSQLREAEERMAALLEGSA